MAPSNPLLSGATDGRSVENRRRRAYPSNAIAAAEAAASYILSDGPMIISRASSREKKASVRSRSSGNAGNAAAHNGSGGISTHNGSAHNDNVGTTVNNSGNGPRSFLLRMQRQRETLMQRQRREKNFSMKMKAWAFVFLVGVLILFRSGSRQQQQPGMQYEPEAMSSSDKGSRNTINAPKLSVPLPPNAERKHEKDKFVASFVRGAHRNEQNNPGQQQDESTTTVIEADPKGVSIIADDAAANANSVQQQQETGAQQNHNHRAIPSILIFTYHTNLITAPESDLKDDEDVELAKNVQSIISFHPGSAIRFLNDEDCLNSIRAALGPDTNLTAYFTNEARGMYKADICRGAALYETGGMYFDIDIEARMSLRDVLSPRTEFVTTFVHKDSNHHGGFFQAFIGVAPRHAIMKRYLELFVLYYEGKVTVNGPLGVYFLRMAYDSIIGNSPNPETIDLWKEIRYSPDKFPDVKRRWGKRRACQMLVVAAAKKTEQFERKQMVPMFSHANGSRMCGGKDTNKKGHPN